MSDTESNAAPAQAVTKKNNRKKNKPKHPNAPIDLSAVPNADSNASSCGQKTSVIEPSTAPVPTAMKKKNRKKPKDQNASIDVNAKPKAADSAETRSAPAIATPNPLFPSVTSSRTGVERIDFGTNDTLTMLQPIPTAVVSKQLDTVLNVSLTPLLSLKSLSPIRHTYITVHLAQAVRQLDNTCCHPAGCRTKVSLIYQECKHCERRYCMRHGLPEVHGCGEAIRRAERAEFLRPVPLKTRQREEDTRKARERMEQKLKDLQLERRAKPAGGGGGQSKKK